VIYFDFYRHWVTPPSARNLEQFRTERMFCQSLKLSPTAYSLS